MKSATGLLSAAATLGLVVFVAALTRTAISYDHLDAEDTAPLARRLEAYLTAHRGDLLPPKVHADLARILAAHANSTTPRSAALTTSSPAISATTATGATPSVSGMISTPVDGQAVARRFQAGGTVTNLPEDHELYLCMEVGDLIWPKEAVGRVFGDDWSAYVSEGGSPPGGRFNISLWVVDRDGQRTLQEWFERGNLTGEFPGLKDIPGGTRLDIVELTLR